MQTNDNSQLLRCIDNADCDDVQVNKVYRAIPDASAALNDYVRIVDDSGEDYLYPRVNFESVTT